MRARSHGSRSTHLRLRVPQWEGIDGEPPASSVAVSQAAVLFDIAYAASLKHHAEILTLTRATWSLQHSGVAHSVVLFLLTCVPTTCQWWDISLFLARFDPGDLINEYILVVYMVLVVGQSLSIQDCATCLLSKNLEEPCALRPSAIREQASGYYYDSELRCSATGHAGETAATWPALPFQCWVYLLLSLAPRVVSLLNALRAVRDVQPRGRRDAALQAAEQLLVLPLWLSAVAQRHSVAATMASVCAAVCLQVLFLLVEPARRLHRLLERRGVLRTRLEEIPIEIAYVEKRWHRLLMIVLAMLPSFQRYTYVGGKAFGFMLVSCSLAYM